MPHDFRILFPRAFNPFIQQELGKSFTVDILDDVPDTDAYLAAHGAQISALVTNALAENIGADFLKHFPNLKLIAHYGVGYDKIDTDYAAQHGIIVTHTPDVLTNEVADLAMGLLLATVRQIPQADRFVRDGKWLHGQFPLTASLHNRKLGIIGLGRIGKAIAHRATAFGLTILYHGRKAQLDVSYGFYADPVTLAKDSDILLVAAPSTPQTQHIVNADVLAALGSNGILINIARGSLVDEEALIAALENKTILSAGLDVFALEPKVPSALIAQPDTVLLPHVGSGTFDTRQAMAQLVVDNVTAFAAGKGPVTPVPETPWPPQG